MLVDERKGNGGLSGGFELMTADCAEDAETGATWNDKSSDRNQKIDVRGWTVQAEGGYQIEGW